MNLEDIKIYASTLTQKEGGLVIESKRSPIEMLIAGAVGLYCFYRVFLSLYYFAMSLSGASVYFPSVGMLLVFSVGLVVSFIVTSSNQSIFFDSQGLKITKGPITYQLGKYQTRFYPRSEMAQVYALATNTRGRLQYNLLAKTSKNETLKLGVVYNKDQADAAVLALKKALYLP